MNRSLFYWPVFVLLSTLLMVQWGCDSGNQPKGPSSELVAQTVTVGGTMKLSMGQVEDVDDSWMAISLDETFTSMVVVATPIYTEVMPPLVTQVRNAGGNSFELRLSRMDGLTSPIPPTEVSFLAVEAGVYTAQNDGIAMEAGTVVSSVTDAKGSWSGEAHSYAQTYTSPVVLGQVMSDNDAKPSVFWSRGSKISQPANPSLLFLGKHVGEDPDAARANETIGYIVIEAGAGTINGRAYEAVVGTDTVNGAVNNGVDSYPLTSPGTTGLAVLSQAGMDGKNGSWALLYGSDAATGSDLQVAVDEDMFNDVERKHTTEQISFFMINQCPTTEAMGLACDGANVCSANGECVLCNSQDDCDDGNECTDDTCDAILGCLSTPIAGGSCYNSYGSCNDYGHCVYPPACYPGASGPGIFEGDIVVDDLDTLGDLDQVADAWCVSGNLTVLNTTLSDLSALTDLVAVGGTLELRANDQLVDLAGLESLARLYRVALFFNDSLTDLSALSNITALTSIQMYGNNAVTNLSGLEGISSMSGIEIVGNGSLADISAFDGLTQVSSYIDIRQNGALDQCQVDTLAARLGQPCTNCLYNLECTGVCDLDGNCTPSQ